MRPEDEVEIPQLGGVDPVSSPECIDPLAEATLGVLCGDDDYGTRAGRAPAFYEVDSGGHRRRQRMDGLEVRGVHRVADTSRDDPDQPGCPICSPGRARQLAGEKLDNAITSAARRDGATEFQAKELVRFATGGLGISAHG